MAEEETENDDAEDADAEEDGDGEGEGGKKKKLSGKTIILFIAAPAVVVIGIVVAVLMFVLGGDDEMASEDEMMMAEAAPDPVFYELPEMVVNLASGPDGRPVYLKLKVALEVDMDNPEVVLDPIMPRIIDRFQVFLREVRLEDLQGSAGMLRLKQELRRRINLAAEPLEVEDVLFREMIVQ